MTTQASEILTRDNALKNLMAPTGRKYGVLPGKQPGLVRVGFVDNKPGDIPAELDGHYTKPQLAIDAIKRFLNRFWDESDSSSRQKPLANSGKTA